MTNLEKYDRVMQALLDKPGYSDRRISLKTRTSATFVGKVRKWLIEKGQLVEVAGGGYRKGIDGRVRKRRRTPTEMAQARDKKADEVKAARRRYEAIKERSSEKAGGRKVLKVSLDELKTVEDGE